MTPAAIASSAASNIYSVTSPVVSRWARMTQSGQDTNSGPDRSPPLRSIQNISGLPQGPAVRSVVSRRLLLVAPLIQRDAAMATFARRRRK
jgi:hypothetical protein